MGGCVPCLGRGERTGGESGVAMLEWKVEPREGKFALGLFDHDYLIQYEGKETINQVTHRQRFHIWLWASRLVADLLCAQNNRDLKFKQLMQDGA